MTFVQAMWNARKVRYSVVSGDHYDSAMTKNSHRKILLPLLTMIKAKKVFKEVKKILRKKKKVKESDRILEVLRAVHPKFDNRLAIDLQTLVTAKKF